jgi:cell division protein FtsQ
MMSNNKKQQPIVLQVILITSLIFVLMFSGWHLAQKGFEDIVPIENVEIEGAYENVSLNDLREKVISVLEGGYFTVDLEVIRNALLQLPWVEDASIRRQWPSGLYIKVVEKQAIAYWGDDSILSSRGELFSPPVIERNSMLPKLRGPEGLHKNVLDFLAQLNDGFSEMGVEVKKLMLDERRAWTITVADKATNKDVVIKLGREDTASRLDRFMLVFSNKTLLDINDVAVIDMRYPNGFAMRKKNTNVNVSVFDAAGFTREV